MCFLLSSPYLVNNHILETVPHDKPTKWCHLMVITKKHDGSRCGTEDMPPLNKFSKRETHGFEVPFYLVRRIPRNKRKTVAYALDGYHSVPLRASDRHLTTFITSFEKRRFTRPHSSSGNVLTTFSFVRRWLQLSLQRYFSRF